MTRAQALLIVIGDPAVLALDPLWRAFLNYVHVHGGWRGDPITWDPRAPVQDAPYDREMREAGAADMEAFMQRIQGYADGDGEVTEQDLAEGEANRDLVVHEVE